MHRLETATSRSSRPRGGQVEQHVPGRVCEQPGREELIAQPRWRISVRTSCAAHRRVTAWAVGAAPRLHGRTLGDPEQRARDPVELLAHPRSCPASSGPLAATRPAGAASASPTAASPLGVTRIAQQRDRVGPRREPTRCRSAPARSPRLSACPRPPPGRVCASTASSSRRLASSSTRHSPGALEGRPPAPPPATARAPAVRRTGQPCAALDRAHPAPSVISVAAARVGSVEKLSIIESSRSRNGAPAYRLEALTNWRRAHGRKIHVPQRRGRSYHQG
jgi:hypothetical protein